MIIQRRVCNVCYHREGSYVDSTVTRKVTIDKRATEVDLCEDDDELLAEANAVFFEAGMRVASRPRKPKPEVEPEPEGFECTCGRSFETERGLRRHVSLAHSDEHDVAA